jgi:outer membrane protein assembly factor BamB
MPLPTIFCPKCTELILDEPRCPHCDWVRPVDAGEVGQLAWPAPLRLEAKLGGPRGKPACVPALIESVACFGTEQGTLFGVVASSGEIVWRRPLGSGLVAHAVVAYDGNFLAAAVDVRPPHLAGNGKVVCYSPEGDRLWEAPANNFNLSALAAGDGRAYYATADKQLHCLDLATRQDRWAVSLPQWTASAPLVVAGRLYLPSGWLPGGDGYLACRSLDDGGELWRAPLAGACLDAPTYADGRLFVVADGRTLFALDAQTGAVLWRYQAERGLSSPPTAAHGQVYLGAKERGVDGARTYALHAIDLDTGRLRWRQAVEQHLDLPPLVLPHPPAPSPKIDPSTPRCSAQDAISGEGPGVRQVVCGTEAGQVIAFAPDGDRLWAYSAGDHIRSHLLATADLILAGTRDGDLHAVRHQPMKSPFFGGIEPRRDWPDPAWSLSRGQPIEAATVLALDRHWIEAARIFEDQHETAKAIALYLKAERPGDAARLYAVQGAWAEALKHYTAAEAWADAARCCVQLRDPLGAARAYALACLTREAAEQYEAGGDKVHAIELYEQLGDWAKVKALSKAEEWIDQLVRQDRLLEAAQECLAQHLFGRAADLFAQLDRSGEQVQALVAEAQATGYWAKVPDLARKCGEFAIEADARSRLGDPKRAAEAYQRAAEQAVQRHADEAHIAALYQRAAECYRDIGHDELQQMCQAKVIRFAQLPEVAVEGEPDEVFREGKFNKVRLRILNRGYSPARQIRLALGGVFEPRPEDRAITLPALADGTALSREIFLKPADGYPGKGWLTITVTYQSEHAQAFEFTHTLTFDILTKTESTGAQTPQVFNIAGDFVAQGARKVIGDDIHDGGQKQIGDRIEIRRVGLDETGEVRVWSEPSFDGGRGRGEAVKTRVETRQCPRCQSLMRREDRFCMACGNEVGSEE